MHYISRSYEEFVNRDFDRYVGWHIRALDKPPEQYRVLTRFIQSFASPDDQYSLLNLSAANGNLIAHLRETFPRWSYLGVDSVRGLVDHPSSQHVLAENVRLEHMTIEAVEKRLARQFDIVVHWMRLLHFDDWRQQIRATLRAATSGGHILISSLFNEHDVDLQLTVCDHSIPACEEGYCLQYNTVSAAEFRRFCTSLGARNVDFTRFDLPFDLPKPERGVGTYTVRTEDGERLQISAGILMQWQIAHIVV